MENTIVEVLDNDPSKEKKVGAAGSEINNHQLEGLFNFCK
jgi:hypothetical protein